MKIMAQNRRASYDYHLLQTFEAGLVLKSLDVKAFRAGRINIAHAFVIQQQGELFLHNAQGLGPQGLMVSDRKLLLHKRQIRKLTGSIARKGMTVVPTKIYLNKKGLFKVEIALATGKKQHDKRQTLKEKEWKRSAQQVLKQSVSS